MLSPLTAAAAPTDPLQAMPQLHKQTERHHRHYSSTCCISTTNSPPLPARVNISEKQQQATEKHSSWELNYNQNIETNNSVLWQIEPWKKTKPGKLKVTAFFICFFFFFWQK